MVLYVEATFLLQTKQVSFKSLDTLLTNSSLSPDLSFTTDFSASFHVLLSEKVYRETSHGKEAESLWLQLQAEIRVLTNIKRTMMAL